MSEKDNSGLVQNLLILAFAVCCFIIGCGFERNSHEPCGEPTFIKGKDSIVHDTIRIEKSIDHPKPTKAYAPIQLSNSGKPDSAQSDDSIRVYVNNYVDSNVSIQVTDSVQGKLLSQKVTSASVNTTVFRTDTMVITKEIIKHGIIFGPYASINIGEKTSIVAGAVYSKGRAGYMAGYNLQNKYIQVGAFLNLRK
jgi:hypothetical protein